MNQKLPLWRLLAGIAVLASLVGVLIALGPVYIDNYRLGRYLKTIDAGSSEETIQTAILRRAGQLSLPVHAGDIHMSRQDDKLHVQMKYAVQMDLGLYQVDLHFHPDASLARHQ